MKTVGGLTRSMEAEFKGLRFMSKRDSDLMLICDALLRVITFGAMRTFLSDYTTVIGRTIYMPTRWSETSEIERMITLRHERVHLRQRDRYGTVCFCLAYLFLPCPFVFSYFRMKFEKEAYEETLRATLELHLDGATRLRSKKLREHIIRNFTGPDYFWMWPFRRSLEAWYDSFVDELLRHHRPQVFA